MRQLRALNLGQRIVLVVALAAILGTVGAYVTSDHAPLRGGWFGYAPANRAVYTRPGETGDRLRAALLWIALTVAWALASVWLLGLRRLDD